MPAIQREFRSRGAETDSDIAKSLGHGFVIPGAEFRRNNLRTVVPLREFRGLPDEDRPWCRLDRGLVKARVFHTTRWLRRCLEQKLKATRKGSLIEV